MKCSLRRCVASLAGCGLILAATSVLAQVVVPPTPPVPATRSGPGGSANPVLPNSAAQSPATQRQSVVGAPQPGTVIQAAPLPAAVAATVTPVDTDREIAAWIALAHREETQLGNLARDKSLSSQVKLLATEIVDDHHRAVTDLRALYPSALASVGTVRTGVVAVAPVVPDPPARPDSTVPPTSTIKPALPTAIPPVMTTTEVLVPATSTSFDLKRRVADQSLTLALRKLNEKQGAEFDAAYVGMMVNKQQEMYAMLQAVRELASPELRRVIDTQTQIVVRHMGQAERLLPEVASRAFVAQTPVPVAR